MTIGKRQSSMRSSIRAPKFLDKASGFYGRLDEAETPGTGGQGTLKVDLSVAVEDTETFHEDDGEMLLRRKSSNRSSRWRSLRRKESKQGAGQASEEPPEVRSRVSEELPEVVIQVELQTQKEEREPHLVHFPIPQEADDQVLIRDRAVQGPQGEGPEGAGPEEERSRREQEEGIKALKRKSSKNYRKALDRALRRGWEAFITNLYSVTLTPTSPASPSSIAPDPASSPSCSPSSLSAKNRQHSRVLAEMH